MAQLDAWVKLGYAWMFSVNIAAQYPRVPSHLLELEILESAALQDVAHMREVMQACQALGVQFALDDFGTGFSSLSYLRQLPRLPNPSRSRRLNRRRATHVLGPRKLLDLLNDRQPPRQGGQRGAHDAGKTQCHAQVNVFT